MVSGEWLADSVQRNKEKIEKIIFITILSLSLFTNHESLITKSYAEEDYIVATVGEEKIYFSEIKQATQGLNRFLKENFETSKEWRLNYIRQYVARLALAKRAEREGIDKDERVEFLMKQARRNILSDKLLGDRLAEITITEDDLRKYYEENRARYQIKEKIKISYIKEKSKREADKIVTRLNKGRSFKKVGARKVVKLEQWLSKDGMFMPGLEDIPPDKLNALFALGVGGVSEVVEITRKDTQDAQHTAQSTYYIFHIDEKEPAKDRPFKEVRKQVEFEYTKKLRNETVNEFIMETFAQEKVRIYEDEIKLRMK